jgi:hypothetical protein
LEGHVCPVDCPSVVSKPVVSTLTGLS